MTDEKLLYKIIDSCVIEDQDEFLESFNYICDRLQSLSIDLQKKIIASLVISLMKS